MIYVIKRMNKVFAERMAHTISSICYMGGVWIMVYTTVLYSMLWMQS